MTLIGKIIGPIALVFKLCGVMSVQSAELYPYPSIGDGKRGIDVVLTLVDGIATDPHGNIYISHRSQNRIRKLSPMVPLLRLLVMVLLGFLVMAFLP